ncbi:hypothetical protein M569_10010, partial [Genlisea aurea]
DGLHLPEHGMGGHYLQDQHHRGLHHHVIDGDDQGDIDNIGSSGTANDPMDGDAAAELGNQSDGQGALVPHVGATENNNQLSLSFQGHVYLFESVSPEKVQAVLLLLGGREVPPNVPSVPLSASTNRVLSTTPQKLNVPQRLASLLRFREKRKERNFDKKIRYTVRKEVALRMQRNKGQFTSSKGAQDESASVASSWGDSSQSWGNDGNGLQVQDI